MKWTSDAIAHYIAPVGGVSALFGPYQREYTTVLVLRSKILFFKFYVVYTIPNIFK